jgi:hypothetical protein
MATQPDPATIKTQTPAAPAPAPTAAPVDPNPEYLKAAKAAGVVEGKKMLLTSVVGRLVHPYQVPLEFNTGAALSVVVDNWIMVQFEAGKLALADA